MKKRYSKIIRTYFSDYVRWLVAVSFLFIVSFVATIVFNGANKFIWAIPAMFLFVYFLFIPLLILYCKVSKDLKAGDIEKLTIKISEIQFDYRFPFKNRVGAALGRIKYRIIDENNNIYLLSASNDKGIFTMVQPLPDIEIEVLKKSRLVLSMRIIGTPKTIKKTRKLQKHNIEHFKKTFSHYF